MNILLIEPYFTGSHASWAEGYVKHSGHQVEIYKIQGYYWKWRMHGGAVTLARKLMKSNFLPDLILATDMLDLTTFLSLTRKKTQNIPAVVYFHENQLTYPWSPVDVDVALKRDNHYSFINYTSALAADAVFFNSAYHHQSFLSALPKFLQQFPDHNELQTVMEIEEKSYVLPLGIDLQMFDRYKPYWLPVNDVPVLLWNHRWEYDKNPQDFFEALYLLAAKNIDFDLAILGEQFSQQPKIFHQAQKRLKDRILHFGFVENFATYAKWVWRADILPVTSKQDFFGGSVVHGIYCNCFPLIPNRLAYPEHIPEKYKDQHLFDSFEDFVIRLEDAIVNIKDIRERDVQHYVAHYDWRNMAPQYDRAFEQVVERYHAGS